MDTLYLYFDISRIDSTFLFGLSALKGIHLDERMKIAKLFEQKQRYERADLKIYLCVLALGQMIRQSIF